MLLFIIVSTNSIVIQFFFSDIMLNLEYWMSELPESITLIPITELAIPGIKNLILLLRD